MTNEKETRSGKAVDDQSGVAAPPDAAGHLGEGTKPENTITGPRATRSGAPELHRDTGRPDRSVDPRIAIPLLIAFVIVAAGALLFVPWC